MGKTMELQTLTPASKDRIQEYVSRRRIRTCEGHFLCHYMWADYYHNRYLYNEDFLAMISSPPSGNHYAMMPLCTLEMLPTAFHSLEEYFHFQWNEPLKMCLIDEPGKDALLSDPDIAGSYEYREDRDNFDYIYDAEKLRNLSGKKYHKKKNHINQFLKQFDGRYLYRELHAADKKDIMALYRKWLAGHHDTDKYQCQSYEETGILKLLKQEKLLSFQMAGIYIDGVLEAFTLGSKNLWNDCAFIHVEKANTEIPGLYPFINREFLCHAFPDVSYVNREDDLGQEGLRKSKLSYHPVLLAKKFYFTRQGAGIL